MWRQTHSTAQCNRVDCVVEEKQQQRKKERKKEKGKGERLK